MTRNKYLFLIVTMLFSLLSCQKESLNNLASLNVYPDSIVSDVSNHPIGINLNYFMDGDYYEHTERSMVEALSDMGVKYLRYPGGEKSDVYMFSSPPYGKSEPTASRTIGIEAYTGMLSEEGELLYDPLDFDEFMQICDSVGAEPIIVVAADRYLLPPEKGKRSAKREKLIEHATEWVRYANIKKGYNIRYWMIGNESWHKNNINSTADIYAQDVIDFSKAMKAVDPSILVIPNGEKEEFFETVITKAGDHIDGLCVSNYGVFDFVDGYETYKDSTKCLIWPAQTALNALNKYANKEQLERWKMIVAEYGTIDWFGLWKATNDMGHAIVTFDMTGQLLMQPQIDFMCFWNTRWINNATDNPYTDHDALDREGNLTPTGQAMKIWGNYLGKQMIKSQSSSDFIVTYSSLDKDQNKLFVYAINKGSEDVDIKLNIKNHELKSLPHGWEYYGKTSDDIARVWKKKQTEGERISLKAYSITVLEYIIS